MAALDPLRALQHAAHIAAGYVLPGSPAVRVVVFGPGGAQIIDVAVPVGLALPLAEQPEITAAGWSFVNHRAFFDGKEVLVGGSRMRLLRILVEAPSPMPGKELARAFGEHVDEENVRFHLRSLRKELAAAFPDFQGEIIPNTGAGYTINLR